MVTRMTTGYPKEYRDAMHGSEFDVRVTTVRDEDSYSIGVKGNATGTDLAFAFSVLLDGLTDDEALDTLEQARNMILGRAWVRQGEPA